jgi:hypothetical protein
MPITFVEIDQANAVVSTRALYLNTEEPPQSANRFPAVTDGTDAPWRGVG